ncbi:MAG: hypothetical protein ABIP94_23530 [Planctomycetota bacterium]
MNLTLLRSVLAMVAGAAVIAQAPPPLAQGVEDVLPASTYAVVRFGGLAACGDAAGNLPMAAVVNSFLQRVPAEVRAEHMENGLAQGAQMLQRRLQRWGVSPADLRAVARRPMALAAGRLSIEGMGPSVALVIDVGDSAPAIGRMVASLEIALRQASPGVAIADAVIGDTKVRQVQLPAFPSVFAGSFGGYFVVTNSRGYLREIAGVVRGTARGLASTTRLGNLRNSLPEPAIASLFVNAASVTSMFDAHLPYEAADLASALGLGGLDSIYAGSTASAHGGSDVLFLGVGGSKHGLAKALLAEPADLSFAKMCSPSTVLFAAGSFDAPAAVAAFQQFVRLLPESARGPLQSNLQRSLRRELESVGSSPEEAAAVLQAFGTQIGVAIGLERGPKPELLVHFAVRDRATVASLLQRVEAMVAGQGGIEWKSRKVGDDEIRFFSATLPNGALQVSPCYVLTNDALMCGSDVAGLVRALNQHKEPKASLAAEPDFQSLATEAKGGSGVLHLRLFRAAEVGWRTVETLVYPQLDAHKDEVGFGSETLPDAETMAKALGTSTFVYSVDDAGITVASHGTLTIGSLLAAIGALGDQVLSRACGKVY